MLLALLQSPSMQAVPGGVAGRAKPPLRGSVQLRRDRLGIVIQVAQQRLAALVGRFVQLVDTLEKLRQRQPAARAFVQAVVAQLQPA